MSTCVRKMYFSNRITCVSSVNKKLVLLSPLSSFASIIMNNLFSVISTHSSE